MNRNIKLNFSSTLEGSVLTLTCENEMSNINTSSQTDKQILNVTCHSDRSWIPNPAYFVECCSTVATTPSGIFKQLSFYLHACA